ncbi:amidase, partial [Candidatus Bipolaricaulota bacterium]|nr:amidase [Candidatus Bipolaricaulota bacterium]
MEKYGIRQLQRAMDTGETTSLQIVENRLEQIEQIDQAAAGLHAILEVNPDARTLATQLDAERSQGRVRGPLHGIPIVLKANIDTADGMTTTAGSLAMKGNIPEKDAFLVSQLREAGAVTLGKANLSEWANFRGTRSVSGWSSLGGQTRNPYDSLRSPCGSSSGSAVAVAVGLCPISVGTETDGSIVCPA